MVAALAGFGFAAATLTGFGFAAAGLAARRAAAAFGGAAARRFTGTFFLAAAAFLGAGGLRGLGFWTPRESLGACLLGPAFEVSL